MSVYTIRHYEGRFPILAGAVYKKEELPDISTVKDGDTYRIWDNSLDHIFWKAQNGQWVGVDEIQYEWCALQPAVDIKRKPTRARFRRTKEDGTLGDWEYYEKESPYIKDYTCEDGTKTVLKKVPYYANNGGAIRDDYISSNSWADDNNIKERGFPSDMAEDTKKSIYGESEDGEEKRFYGYDATWATIADWEALYDAEQNKILNKIRDAYDKQKNNEINKKLDFLINNMKSPVSADIEGFKKSLEPQVDDEGYECEEITPQEIIDEYMINLFLIAEEIGRADIIKEYYDIYGNENFRIIYYLEH